MKSVGPSKRTERRGFNFRTESCEEWGGDEVEDTDDKEKSDSPPQIPGRLSVIHGGSAYIPSQGTNLG